MGCAPELMTLSALIFDVDGTLAETEPSHLKAMNSAFEALNLSWRWSREQYRVLLETPGSRPRVLAFLRERMMDEDTSVLEDLARRIHLEKDRRYRALVAAGAIQLRPGVKRLIEEARAAGLALAVATVTGRGNLEALLRHAGGTEGWFDIVCTDEDAPRRKPAPDIYLRAIEKGSASRPTHAWRWRIPYRAPSRRKPRGSPWSSRNRASRAATDSTARSSSSRISASPTAPCGWCAVPRSANGSSMSIF